MPVAKSTPRVNRTPRADDKSYYFVPCILVRTCSSPPERLEHSLCETRATYSRLTAKTKKSDLFNNGEKSSKDAEKIRRADALHASKDRTEDLEAFPNKPPIVVVRVSHIMEGIRSGFVRSQIHHSRCVCPPSFCNKSTRRTDRSRSRSDR